MPSTTVPRSSSDPRLVHRFHIFSRVAAAGAILIGIAALLGWILGIEILKSIIPGQVTIKPNAAIAFMLLGTSLWCLASEAAGPFRRKAGQARASLAVLIAFRLVPTLDNASRAACETSSNSEALSCGKWLCRECCWNKAAASAIETGERVDVGCDGGIRLCAVPIRAGAEIIGGISLGFGDPPHEESKLCELATKYGVTVEELRQHAEAYETRPTFIIEMAKKRLQTAANLIGEIVQRKRAEAELAQKAKDLTRSNEELAQFAYVASHDLQEPLRKIGTFGDRLAAHSGGALDEQGRD